MTPDEARVLAVRALVDERRVHALVALEQYGWGLREPGQHHRTGRTLAETRAWALQALEAAK